MKTATVLHAVRGVTFMGIAVILTFGLFSPVVAADRYAATDSVSVKVKYGDLDLANSADARELYHRIEVGARRACWRNPGNRTLSELLDYRDCQETAIASAVNDIGNSKVIALHQASQGKAGGFG